ncbi:protein of unknown function [Vibrio tapetis subsp. tapetis]|uniref:Uncharacterized protein n=1 Tax=Vibrio tapetis subsp. tapetis TaxID=1671868 RepID=A0A2N8Z8W9_9VIBR|nr:protein of unknown function [Vibrio tapetis subsp. tapetis]
MFRVELWFTLNTMNSLLFSELNTKEFFDEEITNTRQYNQKSDRAKYLVKW